MCMGGCLGIKLDDTLYLTACQSTIIAWTVQSHVIIDDLCIDQLPGWVPALCDIIFASYLTSAVSGSDQI